MQTPVRSGPEFLINTTTTGSQDLPTITALPDGRFVVAWTDDSSTGGDTSRAAIRGQIFDAHGAPSGSEFLINTTTLYWQYAPTITALPDGRFVVAWVDESVTGDDTSESDIRGQIFGADGEPSGSEFLINTTTTNFQFNPTITALPDSRFVVAWTDMSGTINDTSESDIRGQIFGADGVPFGTEFLINSTTTNLQSDPTITALPDGRFVVAWTDDSSTGGDTSRAAIRGQIFDAHGAPSGSEFLINTTTLYGQHAPTITALPDGRFVVAWTDSSATGGDTSFKAIRGQIFGADGVPFGTELLINTTTLYDQSDPTITALPDGRFVVAWTDNSRTGGDTSREAMRGQLFDAHGAPSGSEFLINTTTLDDQRAPTITALPDGRFVVAWVDDSETGGDISSAAIRGQIFDFPWEILGTPGNDTLVGTDSGDLIYGFGLNDVINTNGGNDIVFGGSGTDTIRGGAGVDTLNGNTGSDWLYGESGHDSIYGGWGDDVLYGGDGDDSLLGDGNSDTIFGGGGRDFIDGGWNDDVLQGGEGDDTLSGWNGSDTVYGGAGSDRVYGGATEDALYGDGGNDTLHGGTGNDTVYGGSHSDLAYGGDANDSLMGEGSSDTLNGGLGDDFVDGGSSADVLYGDEGVDTIRGGSSNDIIYGGSLEDLIYGDSGNDHLYGDDGSDTILGGDGRDVIDGRWGDDALYGGNGNDSLFGWGGNDTVDGGTGNDTVYGGPLADLLYGGSGHDRLSGDPGNDTIAGGSGADNVSGGRGNDLIFGGSSEDRLSGDIQNDTIYGGTANDYVSGGSHEDRIYGDSGNDSLLGDGSSDTIFGGEGRDYIDGGGSADRLYGGASSDRIFGGSNNDRLYGGASSDTLTGGTGKDVFVFSTGIGSSIDTITDFTVVDDTIWLEDHVFTGLSSGALEATDFVANTSGAATSSTHRLIYETDTGALYFDSDGVGANARVQFAILGTGLALTHEDFIVI